MNIDTLICLKSDVVTTALFTKSLAHLLEDELAFIVGLIECDAISV